MKFLKRNMDIFLTLLALLILLPVYLFVGLCILILEGRPIFYKSLRYISPTKGVWVYKFRTMVKDATHPKYRLEERFMKDGYLDIPRHAEVYTTIGKILELTQLVETPQFFNILLGQMSIIGNRPLPYNNVELLKNKKGWEERFSSPAGITGISQIVGKFNLTAEKRLQLEVLYSRVYRFGNSLRCDLYIIYRTIIFILFGKSLSYEEAIKWLVKCGANKSLENGVAEEDVL